MKTGKLREITEELRTVLTGRRRLVDSIVPPTLFLVMNALFGLEIAMWSALGVALTITVVRLVRGQSLRYALGGLGGVAIALLIAWWLGRAEGYFLPGMITGVLTVILCLASVVAGRPLVAWTSHLARRWPVGWYWHPRVRPAYSEVTLAWAVFFAVRSLLQCTLFQDQAAGLLAALNVVTGWPATIVLLVISYIYGTWRLRHLGGPSVEEFKSGAEPPWTGQRRGF